MKKSLSAVAKDSAVSESRDSLRKDYHAAKESADKAKAQIAEAKRRLLSFRAPVVGERDLFDEYVFRAGRSHGDLSWEILAEMRHHGVPTRLLDWTDRLDIALYFALEKYAKRDADSARGSRPVPSVWILNPYELSRTVSKRNSIWDIARESRYDYYQTLLVGRTWEFDIPLPIDLPARIDRIRFQRGYFIVFGNRKEPLENQLKGNSRCLSRVDIDRDAALFCADYLRRVQRLTEFEVFRDLDSLGRELAARSVKMKEWGKSSA